MPDIVRSLASTRPKRISPVLGDHALEHHLEAVARTDIAGKVDLPGVDVGHVPGEPDGSPGIELTASATWASSAS